VSFGANTGSVRPREDPGGTPLSGLTTPTYTGEIEHRVPVRGNRSARLVPAADPLQNQLRKTRCCKAVEGPSGISATGSAQRRVLYPKKTPTAVDPENAGAPPAHLEVRQTG
jgi:hypothetical protein